MYQGQFLTQAWKMCKGRLYTRQPQDGWAIKKSTEEKRVCMPRKPGFFKKRSTFFFFKKEPCLFLKGDM